MPVAAAVFIPSIPFSHLVLFLLPFSLMDIFRRFDGAIRPS
jgi:hypothetical protein